MVSIDDVELPIPIVGTIEGLLQVSSFSGTRLQYILIKCVRLQATSPFDRNLVICVPRQGKYMKFTSNGSALNCKENTPEAFSHFSWEQSDHTLMIVDLQVSFALESAAGCKVALLYDSHARSNSSSLSQGVKKCMGDTWWYYLTDPQMHSFGDGQQRRGLVCFSCILIFVLSRERETLTNKADARETSLEKVSCDFFRHTSAISSAKRLGSTLWTRTKRYPPHAGSRTAPRFTAEKSHRHDLLIVNADT